jgi:hypothetical protein
MHPKNFNLFNATSNLNNLLRHDYILLCGPSYKNKLFKL